MISQKHTLIDGVTIVRTKTGIGDDEEVKSGNLLRILRPTDTETESATKGDTTVMTRGILLGGNVDGQGHLTTRLTGTEEATLMVNGGHGGETAKSADTEDEGHTLVQLHNPDHHHLDTMIGMKNSTNIEDALLETPKKAPNVDLIGTKTVQAPKGMPLPQHLIPILSKPLSARFRHLPNPRYAPKAAALSNQTLWVSNHVSRLPTTLKSTSVRTLTMKTTGVML